MSELNNTDIRGSLEGLIGFEKMIKDMLKENSLDEETQEKVSEKLRKITEVCIKLKGITISNANNETLEQILAESDLSVESITAEINRVVDALLTIQERAKKSIPDMIKNQTQTLDEFGESTKSTVNTALIPTSEKKNFFDRFFDIFTENSDDWNREDIEQDGKHIVRYRDDNGNIRSEYELTANIKENDRRDKNAKKFGLFSRIKALLKNSKVTPQQEALNEKNNKIGEEINEIKEQAVEGANKFFEQSVNTERDTSLKGILDRLAGYPWAKEILEILNQIREIKKEMQSLTKAPQTRNTHSKTGGPSSKPRNNVPGLEH